jgi:hypothetical protein
MSVPKLRLDQLLIGNALVLQEEIDFLRRTLLEAIKGANPQPHQQQVGSWVWFGLDNGQSPVWTIVKLWFGQWSKSSSEMSFCHEGEAVAVYHCMCTASKLCAVSVQRAV